MANSGAVQKIILSNQTPIGSGDNRVVYRDPRDGDHLIKVAKSKAEFGPLRGLRAVASYLKIDHQRREIIKEIDEYVRVSLFGYAETVHLPIANFLGFVPTDLGMGSVTEKVGDMDGNIGQSVPAVVQKRDLTGEEIAALSDFAQRLIMLHVRASDLTAKNIVFGHRRNAGHLGPFEAVLVDGFGDIHAVPVRTWSEHLNLRSTHRRLTRIAKVARLEWDVDAQVFTRDSQYAG